MKTIDLNRFNSEIVQEKIDYCIPASVYAIFSYYQPSFPFSQTDIMKKMVDGNGNRQSGFLEMEKFVGPWLSNDFSVKLLETTSFDEWLNNIKQEITRLSPVAISTRINSNVHSRVVIGYEDENKKLLLFNPGTLRHICDGRTNRAACLIQSYLQEYSYDEAKRDWKKPMWCHDQLLIHPLFKQKHCSACGIAICRAIIFEEKRIYYSEEEIIKMAPSLKDSLDKHNCVSTEELKKLLGEFGIKCEIIWESFATGDIPQKVTYFQNKVMAMFEELKGLYHAVLVRNIDPSANQVSFLDPATGEDKIITIDEFDSKRKCKDGRDIFREIMFAVDKTIS